MGSDRNIRLTFIAVMTALLLANAFGADLRGPDAALALAATITFFGLPHGALDVAVAGSLNLLKTREAMARFFILYLGAALLTLALWMLLPAAALAFFLLLSAYHFAEDWASGFGSLAGGLIGASLLVAPALFHGPEVARIFSWLTGSDAGADIASLLALLWPICAATIVVIGIAVMKGRYGESSELAMLMLGAAILPPLVYFTAMFCLLHAPRHIFATARHLGLASMAQILRRAAPWTVLSVLATLAIVVIRPLDTLGSSAVAAVFMILSALTVPHSWLVARMHGRGAD